MAKIVPKIGAGARHPEIHTQRLCGAVGVITTAGHNIGPSLRRGDRPDGLDVRPNRAPDIRMIRRCSIFCVCADLLADMLRRDRIAKTPVDRLDSAKVSLECVSRPYPEVDSDGLAGIAGVGGRPYCLSLG